MSDRYRRLYRSRLDRRIAGVCGGMADYFAVDPSVVRLIFLAAGLINPSGALLAYLVMVMVIPESPLLETAEE